MKQLTQLRQLIRESINDYIREIDEASTIAMYEMKLQKTQEAINKRKKMVAMEGLDEDMKGMIDEKKVKDMNAEIKALEKSLTKYEKQLEKLKNKADKSPKVEKEEKEIVDEVSIDEYTANPISGPELEEGDDDLPSAPSEEETDANQVYEMLLMQKRAGIISETEYATKLEELEEAKKMTAAQKEKKEDIVKGMKKSKSFGKSKEEKAKMYATATKLATKK